MTTYTYQFTLPYDFKCCEDCPIHTQRYDELTNYTHHQCGILNESFASEGSTYTRETEEGLEVWWQKCNLQIVQPVCIKKRRE